MSIGIFCTAIGLVSLLHSGVCFRCYVCNSIDDENCEARPILIAQCTYIATGCVKLVNDVIEYRYVDVGGKVITVEEWDGADTTWKAVPFVKRVVTRRCGNNYARYRIAVGCTKMPFADKKDPSKEIICYCESEICNRTAKGFAGNLRYLLLAILTTLHIS